jgi:iron complex transport system ATP-binding protein
MKIAATGLAFGFPGRVVGRDLDLAVDAREIVCVLGPNGAGKTTLLRTLLGLLPPLAGSATLDGRELRSLTRSQIARAVAYVPQASGSPFDFTLGEVVAMGRLAHLGAFSPPGRADREAAHAALARLGIADLAERPVATVSGGERQLALIARALATGAEALVLDEPTANLDFANQSRVLDELSRLRQAGIAILLCTHDPDHAFRVADRALLLARGQVLAQGPAADVLIGENLTRLYGIGIQVAEVEVPGGRRRVCLPVRAA